MNLFTEKNGDIKSKKLNAKILLEKGMSQRPKKQNIAVKKSFEIVENIIIFCLFYSSLH